jgi:hypothetical protein
MSSPSTFRRRFLFATILAGLHTALIVWVIIDSIGYHGEWAGFTWVVPYLIDFPASLLWSAFALKQGREPIFFLILGIVYWGLIGFLVQAGWRRLCKVPDAQKLAVQK